jgi:hypothetical protein
MSTPAPAAALGTAAVLSVADAAAWLPMPAADAEAWLRSVRVVRKLGVGQRGVEVVIWGDVVEAIRNDVRDRLPLTRWREIAAACGVSDDTLARKRAAVGDTTRPWFADAEAARAWFAGLVLKETGKEAVASVPVVAATGRAWAKGPAAVKRAPVTSAVQAGTVDWNRVARGAK